MNPKVIDLSHYDDVTDKLVGAKGAGIVGVIHKATQGGTSYDYSYEIRRGYARAQGMLWGAYHFNTGDTIPTQVEHFLSGANPDDDTLMALDFEDNSLSEMSLQECVDFLGLLDQKIGRKAVLYSGNRIRELAPHGGPDTQAFLSGHRLWLAEYGPVAKVPPPWENYFLWQFTGDGVGPEPHNLPGITISGGLDISTFDGSDDELRARWAGKETS